ncbi:MAG: hypothetical protein PHV82_00070 [Victivallaceae bacterium]|nr:hypothetical protein [Victivallaceae bacterium]
MKKLSLIVIALIVLGGFSIVQGAEQGNKKAAVKAVPEKAVAPKTETKKPAVPGKTAVLPQTPVVPPEKWDFLQIGFWFGFPTSTNNVNVGGIKVGAPISSGESTVCGIEAALVCAVTDNVDGIQTSCIFNKAKLINGLQFSIMNWSEEVNGLQLGIVNIATGKSFQIGIVNYIKGALIPWMPVINVKF